MDTSNATTIYTIGHSTRSMEEFIALLQDFKIEILVDIRRFPGSKKYPHFNADNLTLSLPDAGIKYQPLLGLGGRRKIHKDSKNTRWRNASFQAYADYMETPEFEDAIKELSLIAQKSRTAIMCSEAVWWRCHRSMVADYMKAKGWKVLHIMAMDKATEHPYTKPAIIINDEVTYHESDMESE